MNDWADFRQQVISRVLPWLVFFAGLAVIIVAASRAVHSPPACAPRDTLQMQPAVRGRPRDVLTSSTGTVFLTPVQSTGTPRPMYMMHCPPPDELITKCITVHPGEPVPTLEPEGSK
jgi:hypothetical protein